MGGRSRTGTGGTPTTVKSVDGGSSYNCDLMAQVWEQARCQNFDSIPAQDGFRDFLWYADQKNDPRVLPPGLQACNKLTGTGTGTTGTGYALDNPLQKAYTLTLNEAFNGNQDMFVIPAAADTDPDGTLYKKDDVQSYFNLILPDECSPTAILTGVRIFRGNASTTSGPTGGSATPTTTPGLPDGICPNPGCSYVISGTTGSCQ
jgi:hypothetical protein